MADVTVIQGPSGENLGTGKNLEEAKEDAEENTGGEVVITDPDGAGNDNDDSSGGSGGSSNSSGGSSGKGSGANKPVINSDSSQQNQQQKNNNQFLTEAAFGKKTEKKLQNKLKKQVKKDSNSVGSQLTKAGFEQQQNKNISYNTRDDSDSDGLSSVQRQELMSASQSAEELPESQEKINEIQKETGPITKRATKVDEFLQAKEQLLESKKQIRQAPEGATVVGPSKKELTRDEALEKVEEREKKLDKELNKYQKYVKKRNMSFQERVEKKAEDVDLYKDFVESEGAYTEAGNVISEAAKTLFAYGETLTTGSKGWDLVTSIIPGGETPSDVAEERIARSALKSKQPEKGGIKVGRARVTSGEVVNRVSSPAFAPFAIAGGSAAAGRGLAAVESVSTSAGTAARAGLYTVEVAEATRRGYQSGRGFRKEGVEEGTKPLVKFAVEEVAGEAGFRSGYQGGKTRTTVDRYAGRQATYGDNDFNPRTTVRQSDFPTSEEVPVAGQRTDLEVRGVEAESGMYAQETSQVKGLKAESNPDNPRTPRPSPDDDTFGTYRETQDFETSSEEEDLMQLNPEARQKTDLEAAPAESNQRTVEKYVIDEQGRVIEKGVEKEPENVIDSDAFKEEGYKPEETQLLAERNEGAEITGMTETGGMEINVVGKDDIGLTKKYDFSKFTPSDTRKGQLMLTRGETRNPLDSLKGLDKTNQYELVGDSSESLMEVTPTQNAGSSVSASGDTSPTGSYKFGTGLVKDYQEGRKATGKDTTGFDVSAYDNIDIQGGDSNTDFSRDVDDYVGTDRMPDLDDDAEGSTDESIRLGIGATTATGTSSATKTSQDQGIATRTDVKIEEDQKSDQKLDLDNLAALNQRLRLKFDFKRKRNTPTFDSRFNTDPDRAPRGRGRGFDMDMRTGQGMFGFDRETATGQINSRTQGSRDLISANLAYASGKENPEFVEGTGNTALNIRGTITETEKETEDFGFFQVSIDTETDSGGDIL
ncbi:MAG: hypothetical protein ABEJ93_04565 [Candidatus Nanohalobium sp.]